MVGSLLTGTTSALTGAGSAVTGGDCGCDCPNIIPDLPSQSASKLTGKVSVPTGGDASCSEDSCAVGTVAFDATWAGPGRTNSNSVPTSFIEIPVGSLPCGNYRITITADVQYLNGSGAAIASYLNPSGLPDATTFINAIPPSPGNIGLGSFGANLDGAYHTMAFVNGFVAPPRPTFSDVAGLMPTAQSIYLWPNVSFPDFLTGDYNVKNVHITITVIP